MEDIKNDRELIAIKTHTESITEKAKSLVISDEKSGKYATDLVSFIKKAYRKIEAKRKFFTQPLNEHIRDINSEFKTMTEPLKEAEDAIKGKLLSWHATLRKRQEAEEKKKLESTNKISRNLNLPDVEQPPEAPPSTQVKGAVGKSFTKKVWNFEVEDFPKIPNSLKLLNEVAVRAQIKAGIREIPGIKIFQKDQIAIR